MDGQEGGLVQGEVLVEGEAVGQLEGHRVEGWVGILAKQVRRWRSEEELDWEVVCESEG